MPTWASRRSANPAGAFTSPSRFSSVVRVVMVVSSQQFESSMDVRFHCPDRLSKRVRRLLVRKLLFVAQDDRFAKARRKTRDPLRQGIHLHLQKRAVLRADGVIGLASIELDESGPGTARSVPYHVQRDAVKPWLLLQLSNAVRRVGDERAISAQERVLRHLFRVMAGAR